MKVLGLRGWHQKSAELFDRMDQTALLERVEDFGHGAWGSSGALGLASDDLGDRVHIQ
jgi:hypothetical protein